MRTVEDESGRRYLLLESGSGTSRVRDPRTGEEQQVSSDALAAVDDPPLVTAAGAASDPVRRAVTATRSEWGLGLLFVLDAQGPLPVRALLDGTERCESDLHGQVTAYVAADLVAETEVAGERGYGLTEGGEAAVAALATRD